MSTDNYVNVYDFDNTIYDGETLVDFIIYYIKRDPAIWKYIPKLLIIAIKDALHLFTVPEAVKAYASFLEGYYIHLDDIEKAVVDFWNKNEKKIKPWYAQVRQASDIVVSGSTDFILDEIMKRMGIENYVGSSIDKKSGKFIRLCFLDNKVKIFKELYPDKRIKNFYTDSMNDKPMMDISENVYLVKKNKITKIK
ncbi:MAG: haloacid dehalogenase-like hydrolase [Clostridiales bacterium]|nr:haloacid dehalogenase-like hydrolase [Clostridiales bacterium]